MDLAWLKRGDDVIVMGTSGFAIELAGLLRDVGISVRGCVGPEEPPPASGLEYLGGDDSLEQWVEQRLVIAIGQPQRRAHLFERVTATGGGAAGFIHPSSHISSSAALAEGVIIYPNATVHAGVTLGRGVLVNSNATIGHETVVDAFVNIGPGVSLGGRAHIGEGAYIGIGASIIEGINVAAGSVLGAGAVAVRDCVPRGIYVGVPARHKK